jgi:hypothetical protein
MTEEEKRRILNSRSTMVGASPSALTLTAGSVPPAFPSSFSNINPSFTPNPIPFSAGGQASMGLGRVDTSYAPRLGLTGGNYGPLEMGARDFGPARLPQAQQPAMLERQYSNPFLTRSERMGETLTRGLTQLPTQQSTSISEGPISMGISGTQTAIQRGLQPIQTPRGTLYATEQQASNMMTPRTLAQQGTRTPEQQQALLAQMRQAGAKIAQDYTQTMQTFAAERRANPQSYTTPSGNRIAAPTNMFGQPIASWQKTYEAAGKANEAALARMGRGIQPATLAQPAAGPSFGVRGVGGVTMPFESSALSGGPQPSTGFGSGSITRPSQYSNSRAEQRKGIRQLADAYGLPRPFSRGVENQYRQEFSRMGLLG